MGSKLHQALRSLCFNTDWKYAVFWKLKHRSRMMLTWEDAYYDCHDQHDPPESKWYREILGNSCDGLYSHDPLGIAMAKMSYHVYSLGEGIVGQAAVTGKHTWTFSDKHAAHSCPSSEYCDGWQTQFTAGVKTVAVVAVVPHGVVQLGSLNRIAEDLKLVNHIREVFFGIQDSFVDHNTCATQCFMESSSCLVTILNLTQKHTVVAKSSIKASYSDHSFSQSDISGRNSEQIIFCDSSLDGPKDRKNTSCPIGPCTGRAAVNCYVGDFPRMTVNCGRLENLISGNGEANLLESKSEIFILDQQKQVREILVSGEKCEGNSSGLKDGLADDIAASSNNHLNNKLHNTLVSAGNLRGNITHLAADLLDPPASSVQNKMLSKPELSNGRMENELENNLEFPVEFNHLDMLNPPFQFSAGCELYEALGPAFQKQNAYYDWEPKKMETVNSIETLEGVESCSTLTTNSGLENLLEAVVANICHSTTEMKNEGSCCQSIQALPASEKILDPPANDMDAIYSAGCSFSQSSVVESDACLSFSGACDVSLNSSGAHGASLNSSGARGARYSKGLQSSWTMCGEQLEKPPEQSKVNKKRARPGENCRPRPRDRQLIQDRIKELRELVPNGAKCSIDSLLERTIKHMLFMQSITKHADKLSKCAESKLLERETGVQGSFSYEQGSSWAVEVGSHLKLCPIVVENVNMNGQMLIEMLCEDCSRFLEIAEAIRTLGLTILKGITEAYGEKTWMCFVVEGQNNRSMHRMDVLWSLVQILQPRTKI